MDHIVLVHGTFARGAGWTQKGSNLERAVSGLRATDLAIHRFDWSGENSFAARFAATQDLAAFLQSIIRLDPSARLHLIAHSHGGNVALQASRSAAIQDKIASVSCLSTPVLVGREVAVRSKRTSATLSLIVIPALAGPLLLDKPSWEKLFALPTSLQIVGAVWVMLILVQILEFFFPLHFGSWRHRRSEIHAEKVQLVLEQTMTPTLKHSKVMFFRFPGDEASALSGAAHIANWLLGACSEKLFGYHLKFDKALDVIASGPVQLGLLTSLVLIIFLITPVATVVIILVLALFISIHLLLPLSVIVVSFLANWALSLFFGREILSAGSHVHVTTESTPSGAWAVTVINPAQPRARRRGVLPREILSDEPYPYAHGRTYSDEAALKVLCEWIESFLDNESHASDA